MPLNNYQAIYRGAETPTLHFGQKYDIMVGISAAGYTVFIEGRVCPNVYKTLRDYSNDWNVLAKENAEKAPTVVPNIGIDFARHGSDYSACFQAQSHPDGSSSITTSGRCFGKAPEMSRQLFEAHFPFVRPAKATVEQKEAIRVAFTNAWERDDLIHVTDTISKKELRDALLACECFDLNAHEILSRLTDQFLSDND